MERRLFLETWFAAVPPRFAVAARVNSLPVMLASRRAVLQQVSGNENEDRGGRLRPTQPYFNDLPFFPGDNWV
jgi:hypothetical protein